MPTRLVPEASCPCGVASYGRCCGRYLDGAEHAPDAASLMRSRYSAYVLDHRDYLLATWHPSTRPATIDAAEPGLGWLGLQVRSFKEIAANEASVEFVARSKLAGRAHRLHERSRFVREPPDVGQWFYVDGVIDPD